MYVIMIINAPCRKNFHHTKRERGRCTTRVSVALGDAVLTESYSYVVLVTYHPLWSVLGAQTNASRVVIGAELGRNVSVIERIRNVVGPES